MIETACRLRALPHFERTRAFVSPRRRLEAIHETSRAFREELLLGGEALYYRSFPLVRVPFPTRYALLNACRSPTPFIHLLNRLFVVQFKAEDGVKTLLISPSDAAANEETPFFKRLLKRFSPFESAAKALLSPRLGSVEGWLKIIGLAPERVDYISYDHLHTQDLRRWLGSSGQPGVFPNAKLLVMRQEWESARGLLPPQADWYCPRGLEGIDEVKVALIDGDVLLGQGVALMRTPGHTEGNHSFIVHAGGELHVTSENGVGADAYAPLESRIPGVRRFAKETGMEAVLNGNTLEMGLGQYLSMLQEREVAGPSRRQPEFYNVYPSSELTAYALFPGIRPTFSFGEIEHGQLQTAR